MTVHRSKVFDCREWTFLQKILTAVLSHAIYRASVTRINNCVLPYWTGWAKLEEEGAIGGIRNSKVQLYYYLLFKGTVSRESITFYWTGWAKLEGDEGGDGEGASGGVWDGERHLHHRRLPLGVPHNGHCKATAYSFFADFLLRCH